LKKLLTFNKLLQNILLRQSGTERHQISSQYEPETTQQLFEKFTTLGFIEAIPILSIESIPDVAIFGAAENTIIQRVDFLVSEIDNATIDPSTIYLLSGQRSLWPMQEDQLLELLSQQKTTNEMDIQEIRQKFIEIGRQVFPDCQDFTAQYLNNLSTENINKYRQEVQKQFKELGYSWPTEADLMTKIIAAKLPKYTIVTDLSDKSKSSDKKIVVVDVPEIKLQEGTTRRPNTEDTLEALKNIIKEQTLPIFISNQPHIKYQDSLVRKIFDRQYLTIGPEMPQGTQIAVVLDAFARYFYVQTQIITEIIKKVKIAEKAEQKTNSAGQFIENKPAQSESNTKQQNHSWMELTQNRQIQQEEVKQRSSQQTQQKQCICF